MSGTKPTIVVRFMSLTCKFALNLIICYISQNHGAPTMRSIVNLTAFLFGLIFGLILFLSMLPRSHGAESAKPCPTASPIHPHTDYLRSHADFRSFVCDARLAERAP